MLKIFGWGEKAARQRRLDEAAALKADLFRRGNEMLAAGDLQGAALNYEQALEQAPEAADVHVALGFVYSELRDFDRALPLLERASVLSPQSPDAFFLLGRVQREKGDHASAAPSLRRAIGLSPQIQPAYTELCDALFRQGKAGEAAATIDSGLAVFPQDSTMWMFKGSMLLERGQYASAADCFETALRFRPGYPEALAHLGNALRHLGRIEQSIELMRAALEAEPENVHFHSALLLTLLYAPNISREEIFAQHLRFGTTFEKPHKAAGRYPALRESGTARRLRIGYVSADLRLHSMAFFIEPILSRHDRSRFEIFCYYNYPAEDDISRRIAGKVDHWRQVFNLDDDGLCELIDKDRIDILIDLSGHTGYHRLLAFARKPAPIQVTWLGYQSTTGLRAMDYRITDAALDPPGQTERFHTETLIRLSSSASFQPSTDSPDVGPQPAIHNGYPTFASFNNLAKVNEDALRLWARILLAVPGSRLKICNVNDDDRRIGILDTMAAEGISQERLDLLSTVSLADYLALHNSVDIALDSFPYNGGTTSFHSLWMGVPIVTLGGDSAVSRSGVALMSGIGLPAYAALSPDAYVAAAVDAASDLATLADIRSGLRPKMSVVFSNMALSVTRELEGAMQAAWTLLVKSYRD